MSAWALALALAAPGAPARAQAPASSSPVAEYWLRLYPLPQVGQIWRLALQVDDFRTALPKALELLDERGETVLPLQNMAGSEKYGFQQLSYRLSAEAAPKALAALQKLGDVEEVQKNPSIDPALPEEVRDKLAKLEAERAGLGKTLAGAPAIQAATDEIIAHLKAFQRADQESVKRVLFNIQLRQKPPATGPQPPPSLRSPSENVEKPRRVGKKKK